MDGDYVCRSMVRWGQVRVHLRHMDCQIKEIAKNFKLKLTNERVGAPFDCLSTTDSSSDKLKVRLPVQGWDLYLPAE